MGDSMLSQNQMVDWLEGVIEAIHDGILVIDRSGTVQLINEEYTQITGVKRDQIIGKPLLQVRPSAKLPQVLKDGRAREGVFRKEKSMEYVVDMAPIIKDDEVVGAVSVCKSIPEVYQLSEELKRSRKRVQQLKQAFGRIHQSTYTFSHIIGQNKDLLHMIERAKKAAATNLSILLTGESGTGKELVAQSIHHTSSRSSSPFVPVNCAAIPSALLESELFGYEKGAFTSSNEDGKSGLFELAHGGTLFLDEIGDMPVDLQSKLLRVLQEGTFRKIGGLEEQKVDVRIIAATNKDLPSMVANKKFREDLFYRINTIQLAIPPLRKRKDDIPAILTSLLKEQGNTNIQVAPQAMSTLHQYEWPGNIRELKNAVHYAISMCEGSTISVEHLPDTIRPTTGYRPTDRPRLLEDVLRDTEREVIVSVLNKTGTSVVGKKAAAKQLGISLASLYNKLSKLNIT
ncbi:Fis family transcriptional regulator [Rossellomorea marisflavi]|uniref:Fis family transcriptional regulator n=2 Tax=Rossellomorea marisflavi TaxID=189381 RepID=A0A0M0FZ85_9BACI|nr:Fis family transcriptional regulator [Rossellomorea marisflavi]